MSPYKIKICGLTSASGLAAAKEADFLGVIFYPRSKRYVSKELFLEMYPQLESSVQQRLVGVFVNASLEEITPLLAYLPSIQLHGDEDEEFIEAIKSAGRKLGRVPQIIKAIGVTSIESIEKSYLYQDVADLLLFDTSVTVPDGTNFSGGTGQGFPWEYLIQYTGALPFFLSGGIGLESIEALSLFSHPKLFGIDANSALEISAGVKDEIKLCKFLAEVRALR